MDKQLLQSLIDCSDGEFVNLPQFFSLHPDTPVLRSRLKKLAAAKYISVLYTEDGINDIALNRKALNQK